MIYSTETFNRKYHFFGTNFGNVTNVKDPLDRLKCRIYGQSGKRMCKFAVKKMLRLNFKCFDTLHAYTTANAHLNGR